MDTVEIIKIILAPAVMISCCGLFLLGMNNKYSVVVGRIRTLEDEKRRLIAKKRDEKLNDNEDVRYNSILNQLAKLFYRLKLVRNAVIFYNLAVAFFIITCLLIGFEAIFNMPHSSFSVYIPFFVGLFFVFLGVYYATREIIKGYDIVKIEISEN
ncbi:MAG TPA: DUF2721 domain-containing protein [Tenuifilaceae bacterium]|nr:DUF2721 domain-containing protein [Tenuifilaceae bacterium]HRX30596.1 DUF2721 domain-containing protein [Tenuifilaceae bacterium]